MYVLPLGWVRLLVRVDVAELALQPDVDPKGRKVPRETMSPGQVSPVLDIFAVDSQDPK